MKKKLTTRTKNKGEDVMDGLRLQVLMNRKWTTGIRTYNSYEEAERRIEELAKVGIKARIITMKELCS